MKGEVDLKWYGDEAKRRLRNACAGALNETVVTMVEWSRPNTNHGGWVNRSGNAAGSIDIQVPAQPGSLTAYWGSAGIIYFAKLEFEHGGVLRRAQQVHRGELSANIRKRWTG